MLRSVIGVPIFAGGVVVVVVSAGVAGVTPAGTTGVPEADADVATMAPPPVMGVSPV